jgi:hypothetical protein
MTLAERARAALDKLAELLILMEKIPSDGPWFVLDDFAPTIREALELAAKGTPVLEAEECIRDLLVAIGNLTSTRGHDSVRLGDHPEPCKHLDFCVMRDAIKRAEKAARLLQTQDRKTTYDEVNPLGGPAKMFRAIAERMEAGEPYHDVLRDYGVSVGAPDQEREAIAAELEMVQTMTPTRAEMEALRDRLRAHLRQLAPHVKEREGPMLLNATADLLDALLKQKPVAWREENRTPEWGGPE